MSNIFICLRILLYLTNTNVLNINGKSYDVNFGNIKKISFDKTSMRLVILNSEDIIEFYYLASLTNTNTFVVTKLKNYVNILKFSLILMLLIHSNFLLIIL